LAGSLVAVRVIRSDEEPQTGDKGVYLKQQLKDKLVEHKQYIDMHGQDMLEIRNWKWMG